MDDAHISTLVASINEEIVKLENAKSDLAFAAASLDRVASLIERVRDIFPANSEPKKVCDEALAVIVEARFRIT